MAQVPDPGKPELETDPEESLTAAVSPEDAPVVEEFMAEAAQANEAEVESTEQEMAFSATRGAAGRGVRRHRDGAVYRLRERV